MKHAIQFRAAQDPNHLELDLFTELNEQEVRSLRYFDGILAVDFTAVPIQLDLKNKDLASCSSNVLRLESEIGKKPKWQLSEDFSFNYFHTKDMRAAYVLLQRIMHEIQYTYTLKVPLSPFFGLTQTFDVRFDVPREVMAYDAFRRSILVR